RPAGRAVGCGLAAAACPPGGSPDGNGTGGKPAEGGGRAGARKHIRSLGVERQPPHEQLPGGVNLEAEEIEPRGAEGGLVAQHRGGPLRGSPQAGDDERHAGGDLQRPCAARDHFPRFPLARQRAGVGSSFGAERSRSELGNAAKSGNAEEGAGGRGNRPGQPRREGIQSQRVKAARLSWIRRILLVSAVLVLPGIKRVVYEFRG